MKDYHYSIIGGGASGLLLAYAMSRDPFFDEKRILIIDKKEKTADDRTWCFWEAPGGEFDHLLYKTWDKAVFKSDSVKTSFLLHPFQYKMIRSGAFYTYIEEELEKKPNIKRRIDEVIALEDTRSEVRITTKQGHYSSEKAFSSIFNTELLYKQQNYPVLQQHFAGWFVQTEKKIFDPATITFMDFTVAQQGNTRFMYVLPFSETEALVEYTLFSEKLLPEEEYAHAIRLYMEQLGAASYKIVEKEKGSIPMTCYDFAAHNSENILHIGTAGGWTKPSTGYTFLNSVKKTGMLIPYIKEGLPFTKFNKKNRFWYYDLLLLDVLHKRNDLGAKIFSAIFKRNTPERVFRFLDEQSTFPEELKIISSISPYPFIKSAFGRIF